MAPPYDGGYASTKVNVSFPTRRSVDIKGWLNDVCPGDGYRAYLELTVVRQYGVLAVKKYQNKKGCEGG